jgi:hypothetical protein
VDRIDIGKDDGVFWISFSDFFTHFAVLFVAKIYDKDEYTQVFVENEWSCSN